MSRRKTSSAANAELSPEEEQQRRDTIAMLHPEYVLEMENCAAALDMTPEEFLEVLHEALRDEEYYQNMGDNERYRDYDWSKIWYGYELLTGKKVPPSRWGGPRVPFSCAC